MLGRRGRVGVAVLVAFTLAGCGGDGSDGGDGRGGDRDRENGTGSRAHATANAAGPELVEVPDVVGEDGQDAVDAVEAEGFSVDFIEESGRDPSGCEVLSQDPEGEAEEAAEILLELDCRQVDWENQEGDDWELFSSAYESGWDSGCSDVFVNYSPDGALYTDDGDEVNDLDCPSAHDASNADLPADVPDDPEADGDALGQTDACEALFDDVAFYGSLHASDDTEVDSSVCP